MKYEYQEVYYIQDVKELSQEGWRLVNAFSATSGNARYVMEREVPQDKPWDHAEFMRWLHSGYNKEYSPQDKTRAFDEPFEFPEVPTSMKDAEIR